MSKYEILKTEDENRTQIYIPCNCGCSILRIDDWKDEDLSFLTLLIDGRQEKRTTLFYRFKRKIKTLWRVVRGKEFLLYELAIPKTEFRKFLKEYLDKEENK